jgi:hypothetical protein
MGHCNDPRSGRSIHIQSSCLSSNRRRRYGIDASSVSPDLLVAYLKDLRHGARATACELLNTVVVNLVAVRAVLRDGSQ